MGKKEDERIKAAWDNLMDAQVEVSSEAFAKDIMYTIETAGDKDNKMYQERIPLIYMKIIEKLQERIAELSGEVRVEE